MYDLIAVRRIADAVFSSRFYGRPHRSVYFHHYLANRLISLFNIVFNQTLTDIEACYKMMTAQVARSQRLPANNDFGIEVELSAEIVRQRAARLRAWHQLLRTNLRRRQEDQLEGRGEGALVCVQVPFLGGEQWATAAKTWKAGQ